MSDRIDMAVAAEAGPAPSTSARPEANIVVAPPRLIRVGDVCFHVSSAPSSNQGFWSKLESGVWEPGTVALLSTVLDGDSVFVDVGTWIGPTSLLAAARGASVHSYECDPVAIAAFEENVRANSPDISQRIALHRYALSSRDEVLTLFSQKLGNSETSVFLKHQRKTGMVECSVSFSTIARDAATEFLQCGYLSNPTCLIKIDIEGAEYGLLGRIAELIPAALCSWYVSFHHFNVNDGDGLLDTATTRIVKTLLALKCFSTHDWYVFRQTRLAKRDPMALLDAVLKGTFMPESILFVKKDQDRNGTFSDRLSSLA